MPGFDFYLYKKVGSLFEAGFLVFLPCVRRLLGWVRITKPVDGVDESGVNDSNVSFHEEAEREIEGPAALANLELEPALVLLLG